MRCACAQTLYSCIIVNFMFSGLLLNVILFFFFKINLYELFIEYGFCLGIQNEAWQILTEFCQDNALVMANTLFQQHKRQLYT